MLSRTRCSHKLDALTNLGAGVCSDPLSHTLPIRKGRGKGEKETKRIRYPVLVGCPGGTSPIPLFRKPVSEATDGEKSADFKNLLFLV